MRIDVTQEHIDKGLTGSCSRCPVALALWDVGIPAVVHYDTAETYRDEIILPVSARAFIAAFDDGEPVKPFHFDIEVQL